MILNRKNLNILFLLSILCVGDVPCLYAEGSASAALAVSAAEDISTEETSETYVFKRYEDSLLGHLWEDSSGVRWSDKADKFHGKKLCARGFETCVMTFANAVKYCKSQKARLPRREDFKRLKENLGADPITGQGYVPSVLPNIYEIFWTATEDESDLNDAYIFNGKTGYHHEYRNKQNVYAVCCVKDPV